MRQIAAHFKRENPETGERFPNALLAIWQLLCNADTNAVASVVSFAVMSVPTAYGA
jgi:hypothetical protein